ncbi:hypothetical protein QM306_41735, partial [Burkholderia cenocepacia]|nr:hypothetical protein [Burkholderia cenocepacia]
MTTANRKKILLNAFNMNCVGHINHGLWHAHDVREKDPVELAALQRPREIGPVFELGVMRGAVARLRPQPVVDVPAAVHV